MGIQAGIIYLLASTLIFFVKLAAYFFTHSTAVLSDALESVVNVVAAASALFVLYYASQPADEEHPYGHGKAEYFSAAFEGGLISFAAIVIAGEAFKALWRHERVGEFDTGLIFMALSGVANLILGVYLKRRGVSEKSETLKASGAHVMSDVWSTVAVLVGLALVKVTGLQWLDPVIAFFVSIQLGFQGYKIVRAAFSGLLDETDPEVLEGLAKAFARNRNPGVIDIHHVKMIRAGNYHHIDAHLVIPDFWSVKEAHEKAHQFEMDVITEYHFDGEIAFHLDPCRQKFCEICDVRECPIRTREFLTSNELTVKNLIAGPRY